MIAVIDFFPVVSPALPVEKLLIGIRLVEGQKCDTRKNWTVLQSQLPFFMEYQSGKAIHRELVFELCTSL